jgi:hypothetical protein
VGARQLTASSPTVTSACMAAALRLGALGERGEPRIAAIHLRSSLSRTCQAVLPTDGSYGLSRVPGLGPESGRPTRRGSPGGQASGFAQQAGSATVGGTLPCRVVAVLVAVHSRSQEAEWVHLSSSGLSRTRADRGGADS